MKNPVTGFIKQHFRHFNSATLVDAALAYKRHLSSGRPMLVSMAGAMSTAELGISFAEMIRKNAVHCISSTGANMEEDVMNLVAHRHYKRIPGYRDLSPSDEVELLNQGLNRVTDTCIPEEEAFRKLEKHIKRVWMKAKEEGKRYFPHEFMYQILLSEELVADYESDPANSWMLAAAQKNIPMVVPGWEDSTMGNIFASHVIRGELDPGILKSGIEYMTFLAEWYSEQAGADGVGFFQIGGGIAGDFPICVVPMLSQDLDMKSIPLWSYFCQISDSTTSYGSYSGAVPNEKITWGKLGIETPKFVIESDATIVAPLIFAVVLDL